MVGGAYAMQIPYVSQIPVPDITLQNKSSILVLVDYLSFLAPVLFKEDDNPVPPRDHMMFRFFEQLIDGLIYEAFFSSEFQAAGKSLLSLLKSESIPPIASLGDVKLEKLRDVFEQLYAHTHPIRQTLFFLDTLEPVRLIEGKS
jgi:hypothetical protein